MEFRDLEFLGRVRSPPTQFLQHRKETADHSPMTADGPPAGKRVARQPTAGERSGRLTAGSANTGRVTRTFSRKRSLTSRFSPHHCAAFLDTSQLAEYWLSTGTRVARPRVELAAFALVEPAPDPTPSPSVAYSRHSERARPRRHTLRHWTAIVAMPENQSSFGCSWHDASRIHVGYMMRSPSSRPSMSAAGRSCSLNCATAGTRTTLR